MKEIKFRAWIQNGEWNENQAYEMCYDLVFEEYEPINNLLAATKHLMQYTGLKDKNGKEIYEGDIVTYEPEEGKIKTVEMVWLNYSACFWPLGAIEVIGNIHENPELLTRI